MNALERRGLLALLEEVLPILEHRYRVANGSPCPGCHEDNWNGNHRAGCSGVAMTEQTRAAIELLRGKRDDGMTEHDAD